MPGQAERSRWRWRPVNGDPHRSPGTSRTGTMKVSLEQVAHIISNQANVQNTVIVKKPKEIGDSSSLAIRESSTVIVALDLKVTDDLKLERIAKELQRHIQQTRKKNKFHVKENIEAVVVCKDQDLISTLDKTQKSTLQEKIGAKSLEFSTELPEKVKKWKIKGTLKFEDIGFEFFFKKL